MDQINANDSSRQQPNKDLPPKVQEKLMPKGNMGLEQLTSLVNEAVKNKTYENLELGPESKKKPQELGSGGPAL